jgi:8-oxo-dGTP pyrophosphatase MutT (NUDIX family)
MAPSAKKPTHAGIAVQAADTGRVLMLQRSLDPTDPPEVQGTWEFPGGSLEDGETPQDGAWREFGEETGLAKPEGETTGSWTSPNGVYQGFVHQVPAEADAFDQLNPDRHDAATPNPDDPDGDNPEVCAWFDPQHVRDLGPALRPEVAKMDWSVFDGGKPAASESWRPLSSAVRFFPIAEIDKLLELAGQETPASHGNEAVLKQWWRTHFDWGVGGDFDACVARATQVFGEHHVDIDPKAWCARMHKDATGAWPGHAPGETHESANPPEGASMGDDLTLVETVTITEAAAAQARETGEFPIQFISPGWGSSGYYSPEVISEAAGNRVIPKGTHMYADHPTAAEAKARPARSIKDLMAVTTEDAHLSAEGALVGRAKVVPAWQPFVETVAPHIGVSIRGDATDIRNGSAAGRTGKIIEGLAHVASVDFVTRAGRGGRVLELLESAVTEGTEIREDLDVAVAEATFGDAERAALGAKGQAFKNGSGDWAYPTPTVGDLDNAIKAWGEAKPSDRGGLKAYLKRRASALSAPQSFSDRINDLSESAPTPDVPAARPGDKKEAHMGMKEIEESEFDRLTETAGRVTTLESALSKAQGDLTEARAALVPNKDLRERITTLVTENAMLRAREIALPMIAEALEDALIGDAARRRIAGELLDVITVKESDDGQRVLDTDHLTEAINGKVRVAEAEAEELRVAMGMGQVGQPRGLGSAGGGLLAEQKVGEYVDTTAGAIGKAFGLTEAAAKTAATGR